MEREKRVRMEIQQQTVVGESPASAAGSLVGEIASVDDEGRVSVVFAGRQIVPTPARCALALEAVPDLPFEALVGRAVLLVFEESDLERPVIIGFVSDALPRPSGASAMEGADAQADGERLVLEGKEEVVLRCGKSTIVLKKDGRVLVRGTHLVSRSSGPNWIRGASVGLN